jgi:BirA family transcriptional regulator, biotin operon repressor / biotin---[acetyl-CoA-carboxylase] ligase
VAALGPVEWVEEVDSTNQVLLDRARTGEREGAVLVADHQTAGRGRLGRTWEAPPGSSLLVSVLLRPELTVAEAHMVTTAAGLAAVGACESVTGLRPTLKWPNDLVVERSDGTRKLAGLLAETVVDGDRLSALVVGMGLNVNWPPSLPEELREIATALNHEVGHDVDRQALLEAWVRELDRRYAATGTASGRSALLEDYRAACGTIGRRVRVEVTGDVVEGAAVDVDDGGRLLVRDHGVEHAVSVGDVVHLRDA